MQLAAPEITFLADLLKKQSGLVISMDKAYLQETRLVPIARKHGMEGLTELVKALQEGSNAKLVHEVTDAMTTNETFFFRDGKPFDIFRDTVLPQVMKARAAQKSIRIWCAAASTGQEPYSLAIIVKEMAAELKGWNVEMVATDISTESLARARSGRYSQFEVQRGLPIQLMIKYFKKTESFWEIDASLKTMVKFREFNLLDDYRRLGRFDIVFCRNVLIYFDTIIKADILQRMRRLMPDDGVLFLGGSETVFGITEAFKIVSGQRGVYAAG